MAGKKCDNDVRFIVEFDPGQGPASNWSKMFGFCR
jgi:hypothetical protein